MAELKPAEYSKFKVITMFTTEPGYIQSKIVAVGAGNEGVVHMHKVIFTPGVVEG
jgi:hypothetical protein